MRVCAWLMMATWFFPKNSRASLIVRRHGTAAPFAPLLSMLNTAQLHPRTPRRRRKGQGGSCSHLLVDGNIGPVRHRIEIPTKAEILPISKGKPRDLLYRGKFWTSVIHRMVWKENPQAPMLPTSEHHEQTHAKMQVLGKLASSPWCGKVVVLLGCHPELSMSWVVQVPYCISCPYRLTGVKHNLVVIYCILNMLG